ncbi:MAG: [protein ADP-ribosylglutamate] hydrolase [Hydrogenibacillus sp.]|nr:[protein ADP-ribosylglutamate] hydrolase [Hydrogenibacillus sp.]
MTRAARIRLDIVQGDLTRFPADAIVNAANAEMVHGGGVAYAIAKAAAKDAERYSRLTQEAMRKTYGRSFITHDEVVVTPPLDLARYGIRHVLHIVGPRCDGHWNDARREALFRALTAALKRAAELGVRHIAYPAVSAGIYGCPFEAVVQTLDEAVAAFSSAILADDSGQSGSSSDRPSPLPERVSLVLLSAADVERAKKALAKRRA